MRNVLFLLIILCLACSCRNANSENIANVNDNTFNYTPDTTVIGSLKNSLEYTIKNKNVFPTAQIALMRKHSDEILKTLSVSEDDTIIGTKLHLVFYSFSIGSNIFRGTLYFKSVDKKYYQYDGYFYYSEYGNDGKDPFHNGHGDEAKKLLDKKSDWEKGSTDFYLNIE